MAPGKSNARGADTPQVHKSFQFIQIPGWLCPRREVSHTAKMVYGRLGFLCYYAPYVDITAAQLSEDVGAGARSVQRAISELREHGLVRVEQMGLNRPNRYWVDTDHEWSFLTPQQSPDESREVPQSPAESREVPAGESGHAKMAVPAWTRQNGGSRTAKMAVPSLLTEEVQEVLTSALKRQGSRRPVRVGSPPPGPTVIQPTRKQKAPKTSTFSRAQGEDYGDPLVSAREKPETVAASVTPIRRTKASIWAIAEDFRSRLVAVNGEWGATTSTRIVAAAMARWVKAGWTEESVAEMVKVFFDEKRYAQATGNDPAKLFVYEANALHAKAASRLGRSTDEAYDYEAWAAARPQYVDDDAKYDVMAFFQNRGAS